jgi:CRP-like cAMP-binding protein
METQTLAAHEVFGFLRPDQLDTLSSAAEVVSLKAGDTVYSKGEEVTHFYTVLKGQVALRLPGKERVSVLIDQLDKGAMFGSCICFKYDTYALTAQCLEDSELLKINAAVFKDMMDGDPRMGYSIQTRFSEIYFKRYIETMRKLQAIVMNIPLQTE